MSGTQTGRVLAVDDEPALLRLLEQYLTRLGLEVQACSSAQQALESFAAAPFEYSLVLADIVMPGMSGRELLSEILQLNPEIRILVCSGHPFDPSQLQPEVRGQIRFLQKPFLPKMLVDAIEELLKQGQ